MDVASGIDRHPDRTKFISDYRYRVIESSSLVFVLFIEVFSHPYISFFIYCCVTSIYICKWTQTIF